MARTADFPRGNHQHLGATALSAVLPLAFIGLHIFVSIIQAYVFTILPSVYIGMATAEEH